MGPLGEVETTMATSAQSLARPRPAWQLTKRALVGGDTEKVALEWANEQVWAGCTGQIAGQERSRFPQYWPFPASPRRRAVNQKRREFVARSYGSPKEIRTDNPSVNTDCA